jgi:hypothetical protein
VCQLSGTSQFVRRALQVSTRFWVFADEATGEQRVSMAPLLVSACCSTVPSMGSAAAVQHILVSTETHCNY